MRVDLFSTIFTCIMCKKLLFEVPGRQRLSILHYREKNKVGFADSIREVDFVDIPEISKLYFLHDEKVPQRDRPLSFMYRSGALICILILISSE